MYDSHIHLLTGEVKPQPFLQAMRGREVQGGVLISLPPVVFPGHAEIVGAEERLRHLEAWMAGLPAGRVFPFFWIDPLEDDALAQVEMAVARGVAGFKVIMMRAFPGDPRCLAVFRAIAAYGKPLLFHSGILWDGQDSSRYNRPAEFECLLEVPHIRFALAHISWPWVDECIAVYGKFLYAGACNPAVSAEMFIDTTPGTPVIYRRDALTKLYTIGYDVARNVMYGSDSHAEQYERPSTDAWIARDRGILQELDVPEDAQAAYFGANLLRFVGQ